MSASWREKEGVSTLKTFRRIKICGCKPGHDGK